jgi:hypothetical protein
MGAGHSITGPQNGETVSGTVNITTNNLYGSYWVSVDGQRISGQSLDTTTLGNGSHTISVGVGIPTMSSITVNVHNVPLVDPRIQAWIDTAVGRAMNPDGLWGNQCFDVVTVYLDEIGIGGAVWGLYAFQAWTSHDSRVDPTTNVLGDLNNYPKTGDIIVFDSNVRSGIGYAGHIGVVFSADAYSFVLIEQDGNLPICDDYGYNCSYQGEPAYKSPVPYSGYYGILGWFTPILPEQ